MVIDKKNIKKYSVGLVSLVVLLVVFSNCFTIVQQRERGVNYTLGKVVGDTIEAGLVFHAPFVTKIKTYSIVPKSLNVEFKVGGGNDSAAITKDMQSVGTEVSIRYQFDENRIMEIATKYGDNNIENTMKPIIKSAIKEVLGKYSIYDIPSSQAEISDKVSEVVESKMSDYPIKVNAVALTNFTWSSTFEQSIEATAQAAQQAKKAEQELKLAETNAQKQVVEAEAKKNAIAQEAVAKKIEADAIAYYNAKVAENRVIQLEQWKHEEQMEYYKKWNGALIPNYIPLTAAGGIVNLK